MKRLNRLFLAVLLVATIFSLLPFHHQAKADAGGPIFGYNSIGGSSHAWAVGDDLIGCNFTATINCTIDKLYVYIDSDIGAKAKGAIYYAGNLTFYKGSNENTLTTNNAHWEEFTFAAAPSIVSGTSYLLCYWTDNVATHYTRYVAGETGQTARDIEAYGAFPNPYTVDGAWDQKMSIYCTIETPTIGEFQAPATAYYNQYFFLNTTINAITSVTEFAYARIEISDDVILQWTNATDVFSEYYDPNFYCTLNATDSAKVAINATAYELGWSLMLTWPYPEGTVDVVATNTKVYDNAGRWGSGSQSALFTIEQYPTGQYDFYGLYDEVNGELLTTGVNVTAYFTDETASETFFVNGTYNYATNSTPQYFRFDLSNDREYWLSEDECSSVIYIFETSTTVYTIAFQDLSNVLGDYPLVAIKRYVNGTLRTIEKRLADKEDKVVASLRNGDTYSLYIRDGVSYNYGDVVFTATTTITLTLRGVEFPKETLLTSKYIRIYGDRGFNNPTGNITITYEDLLEETNSVEIYINYKNGTNAYNTTETSDTFVNTWASAVNATDYKVVCTIDHDRYGVYDWKQYFPSLLSPVDFGLDFLGNLPFDTAYIIPSLLILFAAGCCTVINADLGAFLVVITAAILAYMGWLPIPAATLIACFALAVLMALSYAKRRAMLS